MSFNINNIDIYNIKFTRDYVADYKNGNPIINSIFRQYDTDLNGRFDNKEWDKYIKDTLSIEERKNDIKNMTESNASKYYKEQLLETLQKYEDLINEYEDLNLNIFDELREFENNNNLKIIGYLNEEDVPDNAYKCDISSFKRGILEGDTFTGETYKNGYIVGLENLSPEKREEYLSLFKRTTDELCKIQAYHQKFEEINNEAEKYKKLADIADNGLMQRVVSKEKADEYIQIWDSSNPFLNSIKNLEEKINKIWLKVNPTEEEKILIEQYRTELKQLNIASAQWSISNANSETIEQFKKNNTSLSISPIDINANIDENSISNEINLDFNHNSENWWINTNIKNSQKIITQSSSINFVDPIIQTLKKDKNQEIDYSGIKNFTLNGENFDFKNETIATLNTGYFRNNFSILNETFYNQINKNFNETLRINYKNFKASISEDITTIEPEEAEASENTNISAESNDLAEKKTIYTTNAQIGYEINNINTNLSGSITPNKEKITYDELGNEIIENATGYEVIASTKYKMKSISIQGSTNFNDIENKYSLGSNIDLSTKIGENLKLTSEPSISTTYNEFTKSLNIESNINIGLKSQLKSTEWNVNILNQFSNTVMKGAKPAITNNLSVSGNLSYKNLMAGVNYNNKYMTNERSTTSTNTFGIDIGINTSKYGTFSARASYKKTNSNQENPPEEGNENGCQIGIKYTYKIK